MEDRTTCLGESFMLKTIRFLLLVLLTLYPISELTRLIVVRDILKYHCTLASPIAYTVELSVMWGFYIAALIIIGNLIKREK
jgi:hypothetical protein